VRRHAIFNNGPC